MTSSRSLFTEAIEDHLALKKLNVAIEATMPLARFDVGDPLDRYPGGPVRPATGDVREATAAVGATAAVSAMPMIGSDVGEHTEAFSMPMVADGALGRPVEPLSGLTPMLSLVEDLDDEDDLIAPTTMLPTIGDGASYGHDDPAAPVLRFPGGAGPRETEVAPTAMEYTQLAATPVAPTHGYGHDDAQITGEQPVIVIDADEPLASIDFTEPRREPAPRRKKGSSFFGLRKKKNDDDADGEGWFAGQPRDFTWND